MVLNIPLMVAHTYLPTPHIDPYTHLLCVGESKVPPVLYPSYSTVYVEARNTARHVITVIVLAFLTQENKASKMQSTIN